MTELILFKNQQVATAFSHLPVKSMGEGVVAGGFPIINYRGKQWSLRYQGQTYPFLREDDGSPLTYLDAIVLDTSSVISKVYYPPGEWDEDSAGAPLCAAIKGDKPDAGVPEPQAKACAICRHNAWTTLPTGRKGKECQDYKRVAVLLLPNITKKMLGEPLLEPAYLKVPPGSLVTLKQYGDQLFQKGFPTAAVITRISFNTDPKKLFQMVFEGKQALTNKEAPLILPLVEDPRTKRIIGDQLDIYEVEPAPAKKPPEDEPIDAGFAEAFTPKTEAATNGGAKPAEPEPVKRGRGRPPKNRQGPIIEGKVNEVLKEEIADAGEENGNEGTDFDKEVADLLSRTSDMLK
ncbi:MAG TPA: hypothetical protein VF077_03760 [Nitrospiraceae bacterium]